MVRSRAVALNVVQAARTRAPSHETAPGIDIGAIIRLIRQNFLAMIAGVLLAWIAGLAYLAFAKPMYTATSAIFIEPRSKKIVNDEVSPSGIGNDIALFESQVSIIGSDSILRRVVTTLKLEDDHEFAAPVVTSGGVTSALRERLMGPRPVLDDTARAVESLSKKIRVRRAQNTYVVNVDVTSDNAIKSAKIANAILQAYQDDQADAKADAAARANALIDARLGELREQVRKAELAADGFKRANKIVTSEGGLLNEQQLTRLNTELVAVRAQVAAGKARLDEFNATIRRGSSPEALPEAMASPTIQRLRDQLAAVLRREAALSSQLQARHPVMADIHAQVASLRTQITAELQRIVSQTQNEYQIAANREREIERTLSKSQGEVAETTTAQIRLRELEREADASREVLRAFLARAKETQEQQNLSVSDARVITPAAIPPRASSPNPMLVMALATLGGLGLGLLRGIATGGLAPAALQSQRLVLDGDPQPLRVIGSVPKLVRRTRGLRRRRGSMTSTLDDAMGALTGEATDADPSFKSAVSRVATRLRNFGRTEVPQIVLFVSSAPRSGTTFAAFSLAYSQALGGERMLLIDAASADPALSNQFAGDLRQDHPCVLDSKEHLSQLTSRDAQSGLSFLPIALADLRTLTLNQRTRLASGLNKLAMDYDVVLIDGGSIEEDEAVAALVPIASQVIVVAPQGALDLARARDVADVIGVPQERLAGVLLTMTDGD